MPIDRVRRAAYEDDPAQFKEGIGVPFFGDRDYMVDAKGFDDLGEDYRRVMVQKSDFHVATAAAPDNGFEALTGETVGSPAVQGVADYRGLIALTLDTQDEAQFAQLSTLGTNAIITAPADTSLLGQTMMALECRAIFPALLQTGHELHIGFIADKTAATPGAADYRAMLKVVRGDGTMDVQWDTDDGTTADEDNATSVTIGGGAAAVFRVEMGSSTFSFYVDDELAATAPYPAGLVAAIALNSFNFTPVIRLLKPSGANAETVNIDWVRFGKGR